MKLVIKNSSVLENDAILAVVVKALQELSTKNDALEARIAQLESQ